MKKDTTGSEKEVPRTPTRSLILRLVKKRPVGVLIRFLVFKLMKKRATLTQTRSLISKLVKKRPNRVLIRFLFSELMKKRSTRTQTRSLISRLVKKRSARTQTRSLISRLVKKRPVGVFSLIFVYERHQSHYASAFDSCCYFTLVFS